MAVRLIKDADFESVVLKSSVPVLVDFYADWCGPCKMAEPVLDQLSDEYKDKVQFVKMDVDANSDTPVKYGVMSIPTTVIIKSGNEIARQIGFSGREAFEKIIKKSL